MTAPKEVTLVLPISMTGRSDLDRVWREISTLDQQLLQETLRDKNSESQLPRISRLLADLAESNELNLLRQTDRQRLLDVLKQLQQVAPVLHFSFSADPSPAFIAKLLSWVRQEIHPYALIGIGLQPTIGAGCVLRTSNKIFDFSLKQHFDQKRELLIQKLHESSTSGVDQ